MISLTTPVTLSEGTNVIVVSASEPDRTTRPSEVSIELEEPPDPSGV